MNLACLWLLVAGEQTNLIYTFKTVRYKVGAKFGSDADIYCTAVGVQTFGCRRTIKFGGQLQKFWKFGSRGTISIRHRFLALVEVNARFKVGAEFYEVDVSVYVKSEPGFHWSESHLIF